MASTPPEFEIREVEPNEFGRVRALILDGLAERWGKLNPDMNPDVASLDELHQGGTTLAVWHQAQLVGTGTIRPGPPPEIVRMSVDTTWRRSGIGARILDALRTVAINEGATEVVLETSTTWADAIAFYQRLGFEVTGTADGLCGCDTWMRWQP